MTFGIQEIVAVLFLGGAVGGVVAELIRNFRQGKATGGNGASTGVLRTMLDDQREQRGEWRTWVEAELVAAALREADCLARSAICNQQLDSLRVQVTLLEQWRDEHLRRQGLPPYDETLPGKPA